MDITSVTEWIKELYEDVEDKQSLLDEKNDKILELESEILELESEIDELTSDNESLKDDISGLQSDIDDKDDKEDLEDLEDLENVYLFESFNKQVLVIDDNLEHAKLIANKTIGDCILIEEITHGSLNKSFIINK